MAEIEQAKIQSYSVMDYYTYCLDLRVDIDLCTVHKNCLMHNNLGRWVWGFFIRIETFHVLPLSSIPNLITEIQLPLRLSKIDRQLQMVHFREYTTLSIVLVTNRRPFWGKDV